MAALALAWLAPATALADRVQLLGDEWSAAVERVRLVLEARESIEVAVFIIGDEPFSLTSMALLRQAAERGVRVRMVVDAQWNRLPRAVEAELLESGVEIRHYHPFRWRRLAWITRRLHDKLLLVDGRRLVVGGRNVESPYFGLGHQLGRRDYLDVDVVVDGAAAAAAKQYFERLWESREVRRSRVAVMRSDRVLARQELRRHLVWLEQRIAEIGGVAAVPQPPTAEVGPVRFLFDPPGQKGHAEGVAEALLALLDGAQRQVTIESPYLIPTAGLRRALVGAVERGVKVRILTNSLASTDNLWAQAGYVGERRWMVEQGVELWEYLGPDSLHAKTAMVDGRLSVVGSFNLDPRSQQLNSELAVVIDDPGVAADLAGGMTERLGNAVRIGADGRPEGFDERYPGATCPEIWALQLARLLAPLIRSQL